MNKSEIRGRGLGPGRLGIQAADIRRRIRIKLLVSGSLAEVLVSSYTQL